jgi:type II secretory pathway component GspD/PulD (secretin)
MLLAAGVAAADPAQTPAPAPNRAGQPAAQPGGRRAAPPQPARGAANPAARRGAAPARGTATAPRRGAPAPGRSNAPALSGVVEPLDNPIVRIGGMDDPQQPAEGQTPAGGDQLPIADPGQPRVMIIVRQQTVEQIFETINQETGITVRAMEKAKGATVDLVARDWTVEQVLNELIKGKDWTWIQRENGSYELWDKESFVEKEMRKRVVRRSFRMRYVDAQDVLPALQGVTSEVGELAVNGRTNELIVTDLPDKIAMIESILAEIDVQLITRVFTIRYARYSDIEQHLAQIKSGPGTVRLDPPNRRFVVTDTFERIVEMEQLIDLLDVDQPMIAYSITNIGMQADEIQFLIDLITEEIVTEDSIVQYSESQGKLIVKDVAEVHDRIIQLLTYMDRPAKQVWLEGEILEVRQDFTFDLGAQFTYSEDLSDLVTAGVVPGGVTVGGGEDAPGEPLKFGQIDIGSGGLRVFNLTGEVRTQLTAMMRDDATRLLLEPRVMVRNGQPVSIDIIQQNPQSTTYSSLNNQGLSGGFLSSSIQFIPTGLQLSITPTISNRGLIEMEISFTNSSPLFVTLNEGTQNEVSAVGVNAQTILTYMIVPSGQTRVIGGLVQRQASESNAGIPYLSRIPFLGWLFGSKSNSDNKRKLLFYITPTIVQEDVVTELLPEPINPAAIKMLADAAAPRVAQPEAIDPLPDSLRGYVQRPDPRFEIERALRDETDPPIELTLPPFDPAFHPGALPGAPAAQTSPTLMTTPPPDVDARRPPPAEELPPPPQPEATPFAGEGFLRPADLLSGAPAQLELRSTPLDIRGPGADLMRSTNVGGPTGAMGMTERPILRGAPREPAAGVAATDPTDPAQPTADDRANVRIDPLTGQPVIGAPQPGAVEDPVATPVRPSPSPRTETNFVPLNTPQPIATPPPDLRR